MNNKDDFQRKIYFSLVVWGENYVNAMLKIALPSFLAPNNIPALKNLGCCKFIFATTKEDYSIIEKSEIFKVLKSYITPVFIDIGSTHYLEQRYARMTRGYEFATNLAISEKAYMIYLVPDAILSDGSILKLEEYIYLNFNVVMIPGPRVIKERLISYIDSLGLKANETLSISSRKLAFIGTKIFHKQFHHYAIDSEAFTKSPHLVSWQAPDDGLLIRSFHLHPLMINCSILPDEITFNHFDTIDRNFIRDNFHDLSYFKIETDSDNILMYSMANEDEIIEYGFWNRIKQKEKSVIKMSQSIAVNEIQKYFFYYAYKLHSKELNKSWQELETSTFSLVSKVMCPKKIFRKKPYIYRIFRKMVGIILSESTKNKMKKWYWINRKWLTNANS